MTRLTRGVGAALSSFALILGLTSPHAAAAASSDWVCAWGMYGGSPARTFEYTCDSGINPVTAAALVPAWPPFKTAGTVTASPVVVDGKLFVGDWSGRMYALNSTTGAKLWETQTNDSPGAAFGPIVSSAAVADTEIDGRDVRLVVFGSGPRLFALDASTGTKVWVTDFGKTADPDDADDPDDPTEIESSPVIWNDRIYVGIDTHDRPAAQAFGRSGGLLVVNVADGTLARKFDPELGVWLNGTGVPYTTVPANRPRSGCGGIWGSPTLDTSARNGNGIVYFGTANCQSNDSAAWNSPHAEAITALDATDPTAAVLWTYRPNPIANHADWDFGATPNLFTDASGRRILGAGNKDGSYYALDPANNGALLWKSHVSYGDPFGDDFAIGGFIGSPAITHFGSGDDAEAYVVGGTAIGPPIGEEGLKGYYHARDAGDGSNPWLHDENFGDVPITGLGGPSYAASATVNGVVFSGALDNLFKAYDAATGLLIWSTPLLGPISSGPAIVGDTVYVGSGTSSSDLCAKDQPGSEVCFLYFDTVLGSTGGIHAFRLPLTLY